MSSRVLVVDEPGAFRRLLVRSLCRSVNVDEADRLERATACLRETSYQVIVTSDRLPDGSGLVLLERARSCQPACHRVLFTADKGTVIEEAPVFERFFFKPDDLLSLINWVEMVCREGPLHDWSKKSATGAKTRV